MKPRWGIGILLVGVLFFGTGASTEGIRQAREWQQAADLATANGQPEEAYYFYKRLADTFPGTPHGRVGAKRAQAVRCQLLWPDRSPASENPCSLVGEFVDFLVWP